jgi:hypothetical protein
MGKVNQSKFKGETEMVITPGGLRPKSKIHLIEPDHHISGKDGRIRKIHNKSGKTVEDFGPINSGTKANRNSLRLRKNISFESAVQPTSNGWIIYTGWNNNTARPINYFATNWVVPQPPSSNDNQLIYLFNGIENANRNVILQPVLQWGISPIGGGNFWSIANWYVGSPDSGLALHGPLINVNPGDVIVGVMELTANNNPDFNYRSAFNGYNADLVVTDIEELVWAVETLECYGLTEFSDYPNSTNTKMSNINLKTGDIAPVLNWDIYDDVTDNGPHVAVIVDGSINGEIDLYYK